MGKGWHILTLSAHPKNLRQDGCMPFFLVFFSHRATAMPSLQGPGGQGGRLGFAQCDGLIFYFYTYTLPSPPFPSLVLSFPPPTTYNQQRKLDALRVVVG